MLLISQCITVFMLHFVILGFKRSKGTCKNSRSRVIIHLLFYSGVSMLAPAPESCRYRCPPVGGTLPAMTACLPEIRSVAGTGGCVWKYRHVHRGEGAHTCTLTNAHTSGHVDTNAHFQRGGKTHRTTHRVLQKVVKRLEKGSNRDLAENEPDSCSDS